MTSFEKKGQPYPDGRPKSLENPMPGFPGRAVEHPLQQPSRKQVFL
jgi:hypothetical protein